MPGESSLNKQSSLIFGEKLKGFFMGKDPGFAAVRVFLGEEMGVSALSTSHPVGGSQARMLQAELF